MKKIATIVFAALSAGYVAQAGAVTVAPADPATATTVTSAAASCPMISASSTFVFTPSKNVGVAFTCDATAIAVNSGNIKGKYTYGGSSNGGSVAQCGGGTPVAVNATTGYAVAAPVVTGDGCS